MFRILFLLLLIAAIVAGFLWASQIPWVVLIETGDGNAFGLPFAPALLVLLLVGAVIAVTWSLLHGVWRLPKTIRQARQRSRTRRGNTALAEGLLAVEGGDAKSAAKLAHRARADAEDDRLALLLDAKAAEGRQDWAEAERAYGELTRRPGAAMAALKGLAAAAVKRGDIPNAIARAREALDLKTQTSDWPFQTLFELQVREADWRSALDTLTLGERRGFLDADQGRRRRAVLNTVLARSREADDAAEAERLYGEALRLAPSFTPAGVLGAKFLANLGKTKQALQGLETSWKSRPHAALPQALRELSSTVTPDEIRRRLTDMASVHPDHRETRILTAELALQDGKFDLAAERLVELLEERATGRLCILMHEIAEGQGDPPSAERWAKLALKAPREPGATLEAAARFDYESRDWAELVYIFGDTGNLIQPLESSKTPGLLAAAPPRAALAAPTADARDAKPSTLPPTDYVKGGS